MTKKKTKEAEAADPLARLRSLIEKHGRVEAKPARAELRKQARRELRSLLGTTVGGQKLKRWERWVRQLIYNNYKTRLSVLREADRLIRRKRRQEAGAPWEQELPPSTRSEIESHTFRSIARSALVTVQWRPRRGDKRGPKLRPFTNDDWWGTTEDVEYYCGLKFAPRQRAALWTYKADELDPKPDDGRSDAERLSDAEKAIRTIQTLLRRSPPD